MLALGFASPSAWAQLSNPLSNRVVNYKTVFDDPYDINQLWLNLSPLAAHMGSDNVSLGYGISARLFVKQKLQLTAAFQGNYAAGTDFMRTNARQNGGINYRSDASPRRDQTVRQLNLYTPFSSFELGGQYAFSDVEKKSTSRIMLTSKKVRVMEFTTVDEITVNSRNRHIWGGRVGVHSFSSAVSLNRPLERQGLTLTSAEGARLLPNGSTELGGYTSTAYRNQLYSNLRLNMVYVGGSFQLIRNVAVKADKFGNLANNIMLTTFADVLVAPDPLLDDIRIARPSGVGYDRYSTQAVALRQVGFRAGVDVAYNQDLHYSFGLESGVRPGLRGQGFYVAGRVSFPALAFRLNRSRVANQVQ